MSNTNTPYVAKNAAPLVNATSATTFTPTIGNASLPASAFSAYVAYNVYNTLTSTTTQTAPNVAGHADNINSAAFLIRAYGRVTGGTTTNFTPTLQFGRSPTYASNTVMGSLTASAFNSASGIWLLEAKLLWDVTSGQISGVFRGVNGATAAIVADALATPVTGQTPVNGANSQTFFFSIGGLFSATNANNIAYLDGFEVEDL